MRSLVRATCVGESLAQSCAKKLAFRPSWYVCNLHVWTLDDSGGRIAKEARDDRDARRPQCFEWNKRVALSCSDRETAETDPTGARIYKGHTVCVRATARVARTLWSPVGLTMGSCFMFAKAHIPAREAGAASQDVQASSVLRLLMTATAFQRCLGIFRSI